VAVRVGDRFIGRYQVLEHIGEGAFANVFRARDLSDASSGRDVAVKVLKDSYRGVKDVVERFQREVFAVASISSPHVVGLLDFGSSDQDFYIVMEFARGPSLRELMGRSWTPEDVLVIVGQIAHALSAAHSQGIVHRDLKPENVMLVERTGAPEGGGTAWQVKVLDFGFAKLAELERKLELAPITRVGYCFGTPQYLSPEQIRGRAVDGGADLFALGVITYEMLARKRPWDGSHPTEVMLAVRDTLPPAVTALPPPLQSRIEEVNRFLLRALAKERGDRPADAVAFFSELADALYGSAAAAESAIVGARPVAPLLEDVSSRSIELRITPVSGVQRRDATELDDRTTPIATAALAVGDDTEPHTALDLVAGAGPGAPQADGGAGRIFVADAVQTRRLQSGYLPNIEESGKRSSERVADDSSVVTRPHYTGVMPRIARKNPAWWVAVLVLIVAALAFVAGHYLRF
jgi:serine/threonine-protein kinase